MAISVDGVSYSGTNGFTVTFDVPTGVTNGDLLFAYWLTRSARLDANMLLPAGWDQLDYTQTSGATPTHKLATKIWNTGDPTTYSWYVSGSTNHGIGILRISGYNTGTYKDAVVVWSALRNSSVLTSGTINSTNVGVDNSLLIIGAGVGGNGVTYTPPTGTTEQLDSTELIAGTNTSQFLGTQIINSGSSGNRIIAFTTSPTNFMGFQWWIPPAPTGGGPQTVSLNTLNITGSAISLTVVPGAMSVGISTLRITGSAISLSVVPGAVSVPISTLGLTGSAISLSVIPGAISIPINTLGLTGSAISLSVVPGAVSVPVNTLGLTGSVIPLSVVPGAISVGLSTLGLTGSAISLAVTSFVSVTVALSTLGITGSAISTSVVPGTATIPLSSLGLTGSAVSMSVLPGAITTLLNTLGLTATVNDLSVYVAIAGIVPTKRIYHVGHENRVIAIEKQEEHHVGYGNRTTNIDEVE